MFVGKQVKDCLGKKGGGENEKRKKLSNCVKTHLLKLKTSKFWRGTPQPAAGRGEACVGEKDFLER